MGFVVPDIWRERVLLSFTVFTYNHTTSEHVLNPFSIRDCVDCMGRVASISGKIDAFSVHGSVLATKRAVKSLLKDLIDNFDVAPVEKPFSLESIQSLLLNGFVVDSTRAGFSAANSLSLDHITLPHCQVLNSLDIHNFNALIEMRWAKSGQECILYGRALRVSVFERMLLRSRRVLNRIPMRWCILQR